MSNSAMSCRSRFAIKSIASPLVLLMMSHKSVLENRRDVNKDSRLKDKELRLEFKHKNQGLSTLSAFFTQETQNHFSGQALLGFCASMLFSSYVV